MVKAGSSGQLWMESGTIHYEYQGGCWSVPVSDVKVIGEHTDDHGPGVDDYFFVFLTKTHSYEASFYAEGRDQLLDEISREFGTPLVCDLVNSTDFRSRVMWPTSLAGQPLFDFLPKLRNEGLWSRCKDVLLPLVEYHLSEAVKLELNSSSK